MNEGGRLSNPGSRPPSFAFLEPARNAVAGRAGALRFERAAGLGIRLKWERSVLWVILGGLVFVLAGGWAAYQGWRLNRTGERVPGTVVDLHWRHSTGSHRNRRICYPVVEFWTAEGRLVRAKTRVGGSSSPEKGAQVQVLYDPAKPEEVVIDTASGRANWLPLVAVVVGLGLIVWVIMHPGKF
ncbi:DUF3592 domain-containing protein [Saccharopolyspora sp. NPDC002686]|uniref:DUF3592 domain-containing protein n=1 Tax=Saccharopolyspora sp. NPDC002686 TaxID=3154541 RepID=UPI003330AF6E